MAVHSKSLSSKRTNGYGHVLPTGLGRTLRVLPMPSLRAATCFCNFVCRAGGWHQPMARDWDWLLSVLLQEGLRHRCSRGHRRLNREEGARVWAKNQVPSPRIEWDCHKFGRSLELLGQCSACFGDLLTS